MKAIALLASLVLMSANAQEAEPYPEVVAAVDFPHIAHWQLTMVRQYDMVDIDARGFEFMSRAACIRDGIRRIEDQDEESPDWLPDSQRWLGFVCEYHRPDK